jgi:hypothetical protein
MKGIGNPCFFSFYLIYFPFAVRLGVVVTPRRKPSKEQAHQDAVMMAKMATNVKDINFENDIDFFGPPYIR